MREVAELDVLRLHAPEYTRPPCRTSPSSRWPSRRPARPRRILRHHYARDTKSWEKSDDNPVTLADLESDRAIARRLRAAFPGDALLSEETLSDPARLQNPRVWIVDPMDGTKEFIQRIPEFGVSIALCERGRAGGRRDRESRAGRHDLGHARRRQLPRRRAASRCRAARSSRRPS